MFVNLNSVIETRELNLLMILNLAKTKPILFTVLVTWERIHNMLLQATIIRHYFVKTQTSVASIGPPDLSIIIMYLEVSPL